MSEQYDPMRALAKQLAYLAQEKLARLTDEKDFEALDGDQTEALSKMFNEELDLVNGNTNKCLYCDKEIPVSGTTHFQCENCGDGMCDECYGAEKEHDDIYNRPYESEDWNDERKPEYVCNNCLKEYSYKKD